MRLNRGVVVRGRVLDAEGRPLPEVSLTTIRGEHWPFPSATSGKDGRFQFWQTLSPGSYTIAVDARPRNERGFVTSRDVTAVFLPYELTIPDEDAPVEI